MQHLSWASRSKDEPGRCLGAAHGGVDRGKQPGFGTTGIISCCSCPEGLKVSGQEHPGLSLIGVDVGNGVIGSESSGEADEGLASSLR